MRYDVVDSVLQLQNRGLRGGGGSSSSLCFWCDREIRWERKK